jgi:HAD superfamily hydrolase (TIGR01549 family)
MQAPRAILFDLDASAGARGMIGAAFGLTPADAGYEELRLQWFDRYQCAMAVYSTLFGGVPEMLEGIAAAGMAWGIVTNKPARFTDPLIPQIGLEHAGCIISGDTTGHAKPHPAPLLEGARRLGIAPEHCWYVGDDLRDVEAGRAAGMVTVACAWGYCGTVEPGTWGADFLLDTPADLLDMLRRMTGAAAGSRLVA